MEQINKFRLPKKPPGHPRIGTLKVRVIKKLVVTHWVVVKSVPNAAIMRGIAKLTLLSAKVWVAPASKTVVATSHL
jgi:hypothetical protein